MWQCRHSSPFRHPVGFQNQAQGRQFPPNTQIRASRDALSAKMRTATMLVTSLAGQLRLPRAKNKARPVARTQPQSVIHDASLGCTCKTKVLLPSTWLYVAATSILQACGESGWESGWESRACRSFRVFPLRC